MTSEGKAVKGRKSMECQVRDGWRHQNGRISEKFQTAFDPLPLPPHFRKIMLQMLLKTSTSKICNIIFFYWKHFQGSLIEARLVLLNTIVNTSSARDLYTQAQKQFQHVERNTFRKKTLLVSISIIAMSGRCCSCAIWRCGKCGRWRGYRPCLQSEYITLIIDHIDDKLVKNTIRDEGSTMLYTAYTVHTFYTVYTIQTALH